MKFKISLIASLLALSLLSCKDSNKVNNEPITPAETRSTIENKQNWMDSISENTASNNFKGGGNEPFWSVEIVDKNLHFQSHDKNYKSIITTIKTVDPSGNTITFNSENNNETIEVALIEQECIDGMSDKKNSHKVEVAIKRNTVKDSKTYKGCGSFIKK